MPCARFEVVYGNAADFNAGFKVTFGGVHSPILFISQ